MEETWELPVRTYSFGMKQDAINFYNYLEKVMAPYLSLAAAETGGDVGPAPLGLLTLAYSLSRGSSSGTAAGSLPCPPCPKNRDGLWGEGVRARACGVVL